MPQLIPTPDTNLKPITPQQVAPVAEATLDPVVDPQEPIIDPPLEESFNPDDLGKLPDSVQKFILSLQTENTTRRDENQTQKKELVSFREQLENMKSGIAKAVGMNPDEDPPNPEEVINDLIQANQELREKQELLNLAHEFAIPQNKLSYFSYLMSRALEPLKMDEKLPEEEFNKILREVKSTYGKGPANSTAGGGEGDIQGQEDANIASVTYEAFIDMNLIDKQTLYDSNPKVYNIYVAKAKKEGTLI